MELTVRDVLEMVTQKKDVKIKPNGRREYYFGTAENVPEGLMGLNVTELAPCMDKDDNLYLGIWVNADKDWNLLVDVFGELNDSGHPYTIDGIYWELTENREEVEEKLKELVLLNQEDRRKTARESFLRIGLPIPLKSDVTECEWDISSDEELSDADKADISDDVEGIRSILERVGNELLTLDTREE